MKPGIVSLAFDVTGMHCASCGLLVDEALEELEGVSRSQTDSRRGRTLVDADPAEVSVGQIVAAIAEAGYSATMLAGPG